jgi:hypothetical protein
LEVIMAVDSSGSRPSVVSSRLEPNRRERIVLLDPFYGILGKPSDGLMTLFEDAMGVFSTLKHSAEQSGDPTSLFFVARIYYEIFNRPRMAIEILWQAVRRLSESEHFAVRSIRHYIDRVYQETRGITLQSIEGLIQGKIDSKYHKLIEPLRPELDIILLEGADFTWEYDPGYYDAEWEGAGPNDIDPHLKIRRIEASTAG